MARLFFSKIKEIQEMTCRICRHCRKRVVNRPRRLCWTCFYTPGVRDLYPSTSKYARRGPSVGILYGNAPLPACPTRAWPGTAEKIQALSERALACVQLFHPDDLTLEDCA